MQVELRALAKADVRLQDTLAKAEGAERLRVLLGLRSDEISLDTPPNPSDFSDRVQYRRAMIQRRQDQLVKATGETVRALTKIGLSLIGETVTTTVVADGTAEQIASALLVAGVERASLDRPLDLISAFPSSAVTLLSAC